jgi:hypothetical protein
MQQMNTVLFAHLCHTGHISGATVSESDIMNSAKMDLGMGRQKMEVSCRGTNVTHTIGRGEEKYENR